MRGLAGGASPADFLANRPRLWRSIERRLGEQHLPFCTYHCDFLFAISKYHGKMSVEEDVMRIQKKLNKMTSEDGSVR